MYIVYIYIDTVKFHNILYFEIFLFFPFFFTHVKTGVKKLFLTLCWEAMTAIKHLTVDLFKMSAHSFMVCSSKGMVFVACIFVACIQTHSHSLSVEGEERSGEFFKKDYYAVLP